MQGITISIHAPLTGSDIEEEGGASKVLISIHAPLTGSDDFLFFHIYLLLFQSTLPSQGATKSTSSYTAKILISIHAPLTGSDCVAAFSSFAICNFNPRSPHRERLCSSQRALAVIYFNPRSPHRERRSKALTFLGYDGFQSTLPSQGATASGMTRGQSTGISIHAPLTGSDKRIYDAYKLYRNFNPRSPHRERLCVRLALIDLQSISIHAPLTGSDSKYTHKIPL